MNQGNKSFIPALRFHWLTTLYDPLIRKTMNEDKFKSKLIKEAEISPGSRVLDIGCGTGTLTLMIKERFPEASLYGLDGDPSILNLARQKAEAKGIDIQFTAGLSFELPYPDESLDYVFSSLMFHHLETADKLRTFKEIFRVLRPGGELHIADWGQAKNIWMRAAYFSVQLLDGFQTTADNVKGALPPMMKDAGFLNIRETSSFSTLFGTLSLYRMSKPDRRLI